MSKRVLQVSLDILIDESIDGEDLAKAIRTELEEHGLGLTVLGAGYQYDLTEEYKKCYPDTMKKLLGKRTTIKLSGNMTEIPIEPKEGDVNPICK